MEKKTYEFNIFRYGDVINVPYIGTIRTPAKFKIPENALDTVLNILKGLGYDEGRDFIYCKIEKIWTKIKFQEQRESLIKTDTSEISLGGSIDGLKYT